MKNFIFLLSFAILFQSCFSYKKVDYNEITSVKKQKVQLLKLGSYSFIEGRLVSKNENIMILENNGQLQTIPREEIIALGVRKFSILKSGGLFTGVLLVAAIALVVAALIAFAVGGGPNMGG